MQRNANDTESTDDKKKKSKNQRDEKSTYAKNITFGLRVQELPPCQSNSRIYDYAATAATHISAYAKHSALKLMRREIPTLPAPVKPDVEADSIALNQQLAKYEDEIKQLFANKKLVDTEISALKEKKADIDPALIKRQLSFLEMIDDILVKKVLLTAEMIREHATKRGDLFLLLGVAVYKKQVNITKGPTVRQHGVGSKITGTAACHASLIPNPIITPLETQPAVQITSWFTRFYKAITTEPQKPFSIADRYIMDEMNVTTELVKVVNDFDGHMEGKYDKSNAVKECIAILNRCAKGEINPIELFHEYANVMKLFFHHMEYRYVLPEPRYFNHGEVPFPKAFKLVWQFEKEGTMRALNPENMQPLWEYLSMMLGIQQLPAAKRAAGFVYQGYIEECILARQREILATPSEFKVKNSGKKA